MPLGEASAAMRKLHWPDVGVDMTCLRSIERALFKGSLRGTSAVLKLIELQEGHSLLRLLASQLSTVVPN